MLKKELNSLKEQIRNVRNRRYEEARTVWRDNSSSESVDFTCRYTIKGNHGKATHVKWGLNNDLLTASAGAQNYGVMVMWDALFAKKTKIIVPTRSWLLTCSIDLFGSGNIIATGGIENICQIYNIESEGIIVEYPEIELNRHEGYISDCAFVAEGSLLTSGGDRLVMLWDISKENPKQVFAGHTSDVLTVSGCPTDENIFVSGSVDKTARVWDSRTKLPVATFDRHTEDVNSIDWFPDGKSIVTGSEDGSCYLFDLRAKAEILSLGRGNRSRVSVQQVKFSKSGRFAFVLDDDKDCFAYDLRAYDDLTRTQGVHRVNKVNPVSCMDVHPQGYVLAMGEVLQKGPKDCIVGLYTG